MNENLRSILVILITFALLAACTIPPTLLARNGYPLLGCVLALAALMVWTKLVRPMPGILQGIVCLTGMSFFLGTAFICLLRWII